jgi:hypothetical protein
MRGLMPSGVPKQRDSKARDTEPYKAVADAGRLRAWRLEANKRGIKLSHLIENAVEAYLAKETADGTD